MAQRKRSDNVVDAEAMGFVAPADPTTGEAGGVFEQLLAGTEDDAQAVELSAEESANLGENYRIVADLTRKKKELEDQVKAVSAALTEAKLNMEGAMRMQGTKQFRGADDDGSCTVATRYDTTVTDPKSFLDWCFAQAPELLDVNSQRRTKYIRENFKNKGIPTDSEEFPPGIETTEREFLQVRGVQEIGASQKKGKKKGK